jgi:hypothetical protein
MLIIGRAVAGLGSAGLQNGAFTIIAGAVPMQQQPGKYTPSTRLFDIWLIVICSSDWDHHW